MNKKMFCLLLAVLLTASLFPAGIGGGGGSVAAAGVVLWQLGQANDSSGEFADYSTSNPESVTVPSDWSTRTSWNFMSKGLKGDRNKVMNITYSLSSIPANGVMFSFKALDAHKSTPQLAVFSNGTMAGLIQIAGVSGSGSPHAYKETYELYIPKEFLKTGSNTLRLEAARCMYCSATEDPYLWFAWDYAKLATLDAPAAEPLHGRYVHLGTTVMEGHFGYNADAVRHLPYVLKWLGIAHSGNIIRTALWSDIAADPAIPSYLQTAKQYNMGIVADHLNSQITLDPDGTLPASAETALQQFFTNYGNLIQYYEIDNEPGLFNRSKAVNIAIANYVNQIKPQHVKSVAPGWAYWPTGGTPDGWERDPVQRKQVEDLTDLTNGHSYGTSYADTRGGSFTETLLTYGGAQNGLPKEMLVTEFGANDYHTDDSIYGSASPHASIFDRILRGHVGFADHFMQHAAFFDDGSNYALLDGSFNWSTHDPATTAVQPGVNGEEPRLAAYRRGALAYATHGAPLEYTYLNGTALTNKKGYFRAVNTATLTPLAGSGAISNKVLLNFVNFESETLTMNVRVKLPQAGTYTGERFGAGSTYNASRSVVSGLAANPYVDISETIAPGQSVQYILELAGTSAPAAPSWISAVPGATSAHISWGAVNGATSYTVKRGTSASGPFNPIASNVTATSYTDQGLNPDTAYYYVVSASNSAGASGNSAVASATPSLTLTLEAEHGAGGGATAQSGDPYASGNGYAGQLQNWGSYIRFENVDGGSGGQATLKVRYATAVAGVKKSLYINGVDVEQLNFASTGHWCCNANSYSEITTTVQLAPGMTNTIMIRNDSSQQAGEIDPYGVDIDKLTLTLSAGGGAGGITREYWLNASGMEVSDIPLAQPPSGSDTLTSLEAPTNWADNYGTRIRGYITPPASGNYTFYIASDDSSELWLGTSNNPASKAKIAHVQGWTDPRQWNKYSSQQSVAVNLTAGVPYYVEILHKEGLGGDNLAVGWTGPGIGSITVVPGSSLSPYSAGGGGGTTTAQFGFGGGGSNAWTPVDGTWTVVGGSDYSVSGGGKSMLTGGVFADGSNRLDLSPGSGGHAGVIFRASSVSPGTNAFNGYYAGIASGGTVMLGKVTNGIYTSLGTASISSGGWYTLRVVATGSLIQVYAGPGSSPVISVTDGTYAAGGAGLMASGTGSFNNYYLEP